MGVRSSRGGGRGGAGQPCRPGGGPTSWRTGGGSPERVMSDAHLSSTPETSDQAGVSRIENVTCLACGCLCDDLVVTTDQGRVIQADHACAMGREWFLEDRDQAAIPAA